MWDFAADIAKMADCEAILEFVYENCLDNGATWFSYHFTPIFESQTSKKTFIWSRDYPLEFQRRYVSGAWREIDPVPRLTFQYGPVLVWRDAIELGRGDPRALPHVGALEVERGENLQASRTNGARCALTCSPRYTLCTSRRGS